MLQRSCLVSGGWSPASQSAARVRSQVSPREICVGRSGNGTGFPPHTAIFSYIYNCTKLPHPSSSTRCSFQQDKRAKSANVTKATLFRKSARSGKERAFTYFILRMVKARRLTLWNGLKYVGIESSYGYSRKCRVL